MANETDTKRQWRSRRNLLIYMAFRQGFSNPFIADAFDLSPSVVRAILRGFSKFEKAGDGEEPRERRRSPGGGHAVPPPADLLHRRRRNELIRLGHRQGLSQRFLADVFDLPRSRVAEILQGGPA
jgi:hypothetical protein